MATTTEKKQATVKQSVVVATGRDGTVHEYHLSPLNIYLAGKTEASPIGVTFGAAWLEAGKPEGSLEAWLGTLVEVREEEQTIPPPNGKPR